MNESSIYFIAKVSNGSLSIGPRPQAQSLETWVNALNTKNIHHVVSLIEDAEIDRHGLRREEFALSSAGIGFTRFPIGDFQTPDPATFPQFIEGMSKRLSDNENILLHCAGGIGRAGTTASCLMIEHGMAPDAAMDLVSKQRGERSPETDEQVDFVRTFQP